HSRRRNGHLRKRRYLPLLRGATTRSTVVRAYGHGACACGDVATADGVGAAVPRRAVLPAFAPGHGRAREASNQGVGRGEPPQGADVALVVGWGAGWAAIHRRR